MMFCGNAAGDLVAITFSSRLRICDKVSAWVALRVGVEGRRVGLLNFHCLLYDGTSKSNQQAAMADMT
jgi:hypothetical protein